jgi:cholesterol transport system auxiliary component
MTYVPYRLIAVAAVAAGLLTACSIVPKSDPPAVYQLAPAGKHAAVNSPALPFSLSIDTPQSSRTIDSTRILVQPQETRLNAYKGARWGDTVPAMLRQRFTQALRQTGALQAVSNDNLNYRTDLSLGSEVMAFQVQYHSSGVKAVVMLDAFLSEPAGQSIIAAQRFTAEHALTDPSVQSAVQALSTASDQLTHELVQWTLQQLASYGQRPAGG